MPGGALASIVSASGPRAGGRRPRRAAVATREERLQAPWLDGNAERLAGEERGSAPVVAARVGEPVERLSAGLGRLIGEVDEEAPRDVGGGGVAHAQEGVDDRGAPLESSERFREGGERRIATLEGRPRRRERGLQPRRGTARRCEEGAQASARLREAG